MSHVTRIVIALNPDGTHKGSAVYEAELVAGRVYDLDPRPIAAGDAAALAAALEGPHAAALAAVESLTAQVATLTQERDQATQAKDAALEQVAALQAQLATSQADDLPAAIRMERDRRIAAGVKVGNDWFHSDMQFQIQVLGMVIMGANLPAGTPLKTLAGSIVTATPTLVQQIFGATAQQMAALHAIADAAIAAGTPLDQIQWPASYSPA